MIVDAHLHIWSQDIEKYPWNPIGGYVPEKSASIEDYIRVTDANSVEKAVIVQPTPYGWDNSYLLDVCRGRKDRFKSVVLVNPLSEEAGDELVRLIDAGADGLRINLHLLPNDYFGYAPFHDLIATAQKEGLPVCFQLTPENFDAAQKIIEQYSQTQFIFDHMGRPDTGSSPDSPSFLRFLRFEKYPNVYIKLSGLNYFCGQAYPYKDTWPLLKAALAQFSAERCMWGSDYPFVDDHWSYKGNLETMQNDIGFSEMELSWILEKTAKSIWWKK